MSINLENRLSLRYIPKNNFSISTAWNHIHKIIPIFGHHSDAITMIIHCTNKWLCKYFLKLSRIQCSFILSCFLKRVKNWGCWWCSLNFCKFWICLFYILFFISTYCFYFYHFYPFFKIVFFNIIYFKYKIIKMQI